MSRGENPSCTNTVSGITLPCTIGSSISAATYRDVSLFFHDERLYPEAAGFWMLGRRTSQITVAVPPHGRETFEALAALFEQHRGDKPVTLQLELRDRERPLRVRAQVSSHLRVSPSPAFLAEVTRLCGDGSVLLR